MFELSLATARDYLLQRAWVPPGAPVEIEALSGGISNIVLKVSLPGDCFVIKQSLPKLRVAEEWLFDQSRIYVERDCMRLLGDLLPPGSVPTVRFSDDGQYVFGMSCAPLGGRVWKTTLLQGEVDLAVARRAGQWLARMHNGAARLPITQQRFASLTGFVQGRLDPYHRTVAKAHPDLAPLIEAEIERMLATRLTLVHGDYSPKNILVYPDHVLVLDFEVAHLGDPAFDAAFCLTHLVLKAAHFADQSPAYLAAAHEFWRSYSSALHAELGQTLEAATVRELGCLVLARIDGKSKAEYITQAAPRQTCRRIGRELLQGGQASVADALQQAGRLIHNEL